jgi:hypothetical protein
LLRGLGQIKGCFIIERTRGIVAEKDKKEENHGGNRP